MRSFSRTQLKRDYDCKQLNQLISDYMSLLLANLLFVLHRYDPVHGNGMIDTKFDIQNACDFDEPNSIKGKNIVYGWVQGRALEALVEHCYWIKEFEYEIGGNTLPLQEEILNVLTRLSGRLEDMRNRQSGRLSFMMMEDGTPLTIDQYGQLIEMSLPGSETCGYTDIFYAKGLFAAAKLLGDDSKLSEAIRLFDFVIDSIEVDRFASDQLTLDVRNRGLTQGLEKRTHASRMIALGGLSLFLEGTGDQKYAEVGMSFIRHIIGHYVNLCGCFADVPRFAMWEYTTLTGAPFVADGQLRSLPGHVVEFVGLSLKFIRCCEGIVGKRFQADLDEFRKVLPRIMMTSFGSGWNPVGFGIYQSVDLFNSLPLYTQMPWWNLPETIRAAMECAHVVADREKKDFHEIGRKCSNAFFRYYVQSAPNLLAVQALNKDGRPDRSIPAVPDVDPCYHTGLSIIDSLRLV